MAEAAEEVAEATSEVEKVDTEKQEWRSTNWYALETKLEDKNTKFLSQPQLTRFLLSKMDSDCSKKTDSALLSSKPADKLLPKL